MKDSHPASSRNNLKTIMSAEQDDFEKSLAIARKVLPFLGERNIPATPENYMIFYIYFGGESENCRRVVDQQLALDQPWDHIVTKRLFGQLFGAQAGLNLLRHNEHLAKKVQAAAREIIDETQNAAQVADSTTDTLNESLRQAQDFTDVRDLTDWLRSTMAEIGKISTVGKHFADLLEKKGRELEDVVKSLDNLEKLAMTDELTQLANRRAWDARLLHEWDRYLRLGRPCALFILDLDDFKVVNDTFGHKVGDEVLKAVGKLITLGLRKMDLGARYGGEEFACILPEIELGMAVQVAERIRHSVANTNFTVRGKPVLMTTSVGVGSFHRSDSDPEAALIRADNALYRAKSAGKNQVMTEVDL